MKTTDKPNTFTSLSVAHSKEFSHILIIERRTYYQNSVYSLCMSVEHVKCGAEILIFIMKMKKKWKREIRWEFKALCTFVNIFLKYFSFQKYTTCIMKTNLMGKSIVAFEYMAHSLHAMCIKKSDVDDLFSFSMFSSFFYSFFILFNVQM